MNTIAHITTQPSRNPGVNNFLTTRKTEMEEASRDLELESLGIPEPVLFSSHLVLILGVLRDQKKSVSLNGFLIPFARLVDEYVSEPLPAVAVVTLAKHVFNSNKGWKLRELAKRYQDSARDHLEGRFLDMGRGKPA